MCIFISMKLKLFFSLFFTFIFFTVIGTLTHEYGHYFAGKLVGISSTVHYSYTDIEEFPRYPEVDEIYKTYKQQIEAKQDFPLKQRFETLVKDSDQKYFYFTIGGPLQTMLTGTIGLLLMIVYRKTFFATNTLNVRQWLLIFLSLFWLRELANCVVLMAMLLFTNKRSFYSDEVKIAEYFGWHFTSVSIMTAIMALIIGLIITFKFVPAAQRKFFIAAGFAGGIVGYILWLYIIGPIILP